MINYDNDEELFSLIREVLYTAVVGDILDKKGYQHQFLPPNVRPIDNSMIVIGRAMTVLEADMNSEGIGANNPILKKPFGIMLEALDNLKENEVYVCSGSSSEYALVGELMATRAKFLNASGFVANGYIRDTKGLLNLGLPIFGYGSYSQDQAPRGKVIDYRVPLKFGQVIINPGDIVFGDIDGVVIIPQAIEKEIIKEAYEKATGEHTVENAIRNGMSSKEAFDKFGIM